jgi:SAM-dependent methyltransferase
MPAVRATIGRMVEFICNVCASRNAVSEFATEPASCACGSNVRTRALIHLLSTELFGRSLILVDFPRLKSVRGLGMSDKECYAAILQEKFEYRNTFYDREPQFDFSKPHADLAGTFDFVLSADVLEHVAPPVEDTLMEVHRLLKPHGFLVATVPCSSGETLREHYPDLYEYRILPLGGAPVLVNRRRDGQLEVTGDLVFHGGTGATLEMRQFTAAALHETLLASRFTNVRFFNENIPELGILFDHDVSQPLIAAKEQPFALTSAARVEIIDQWRSAEDRAWSDRQLVASAEKLARETCALNETLAARMRLASGSRWLRLGRAFGIGPKLT